MGPRAKSRTSVDTDGILSLDKGITKKKMANDTGNVFLDSVGKAEGFVCDAQKQRRSAPILSATLQPLGAVGSTAGPDLSLDQIK